MERKKVIDAGSSHQKMHDKEAKKVRKRQNNTKYAPRAFVRRYIAWYNTLESCCVDLLIRRLWDGDYIPKIIQSHENVGFGSGQ